MWRVKCRAVPSKNRGILRCSAWVRFSNWIWNLGPKYLRARKPNRARQTNLKPIRRGLSKVLLNGYKFRRNDKGYRIKSSGLWRKQYIWRIMITTINHLQDGICHHGCCRCARAKQASGHQQPPCCKYRLFTRFHWKLICRYPQGHRWVRWVQFPNLIRRYEIHFNQKCLHRNCNSMEIIVLV